MISKKEVYCMKNLVLVSSVLLFFIGISGCDQFSGQQVSPGEGSGTTYTSPEPEGPVLARVNNWVLGVEEFEEEINNIIKANNGNPEIPVESLGLLARMFVSPFVTTIDLSTPEGKKVYLDLLVNSELLAQEAEKRGLDEQPRIKERIRRRVVEILNLALLNEVLKDYKVTPSEVEEFYNTEYKKVVENMEQRKIREIVVDLEYKAKDILVEILGGADFSTLASTYSITPSAEGGGDLGYLTYNPNEKFQKFWEIALTLGEGEVSNVFKHPEKQEYYIIRVEDVRKGEPESLNKVYNQLEYLLTQKKSIEGIDKFLKDIKAKSDVTVNANYIN
ncbi:MAG: hypothetical protein GF375_06330 [Candidatus Omnitrophica bacterium]|nr:hypothetical protein [Candidatus Omnitrophota bacterium]MBD3269592.1 hypothetical protein [Candidatus Omnitrophota bacterium]